ncbi:hypothetical protein D3C73_1371500 [compost metagenome]
MKKPYIPWFCDTCVVSFLEDFIICKLVSNPIGNDNQDEANPGFEQTNRRTEAILSVEQGGAIYISIYNVTGTIYQWIIKVEDLVKACIKNVS